jgi:hypothetical protein
VLRDEAEMRAFYKSVGISPETAELAILARRQKPVAEQERPSAPKGKKRRRPSRRNNRSRIDAEAQAIDVDNRS